MPPSLRLNDLVNYLEATDIVPVLAFAGFVGWVDIARHTYAQAVCIVIIRSN